MEPPKITGDSLPGEAAANEAAANEVAASEVAADVTAHDAADGQEVDPTARKRKRSEFESETMRVVVIDNKSLAASRTYNVHQDTLSAASPYFAALANFKEGEEKQVTLDGMNHKAFENILNWVYKGRFLHACKKNPYFLIHTWNAADRLLMGKCKNVVMDRLRGLNTYLRMAPSDLVLVSKLGHSTSSPLGRYMLDQSAYDSVQFHDFDIDSASKDYLRDLPEELMCAFVRKVVELARVWYRRSEGSGNDVEDPAYEKGCQYHDHVAGEGCYLTGDEVPHHGSEDV